MAVSVEAFAFVAPLPTLPVTRPASTHGRTTPEAPEKGASSALAAAATACAAVWARRRSTGAVSVTRRKASEAPSKADSVFREDEGSSADARQLDAGEGTSLEAQQPDVAGEEPAGSDDDDQEPIEEDDDDQVERLMGLEAMQGVRKMPTPPPAQCATPSRPSSEELPICDMRDEIQEMIAKNRVSIIVGGTGCGKSTQVPQFIIQEAAKNQTPCNILVTQPRRLAATSLARRVAEELGLVFGVEVGYRIRGETVPGDHLSFVTAGYLLSWLTADPSSAECMTHLICDEAHIRTADMELLLLTLRLVLRVNPHLRLVLMSATIEADFFGKYFAEFSEDKDISPVPKYVGNRLFPIEVFHLDDLAKGQAPGGREVSDNLRRRTAKLTKKIFPADLVKSSRGAAPEVPLESVFQPKVQPSARELVQELIPEVAEGGSTILIFVPGYADLLRMHSWLYWNLPTVGSVNMGYVPPKPDQLPEDDDEEEEEDFEEIYEMEGMEGPFAKPVSPTSKAFDKPEGSAGSLRFRLFALHSQVAQEDQELVLEKPPPDICNVVLATTIAESSLTLPQVIGVIDFCIHKTSVGDPSQMGLEKLMAQWCARSACLQREGRAGRTQPGWCLRMVPDMFFKECMMEYDIPEILRTPLTTLYLKAKGIADGMGKIVEGNKARAEQLRLGRGTPGELLAELLAPPGEEAINAAVHKLAQLAVLTEESPDAKVTVLGRLALYLPLDVQLCRLVWLGCLLGCPAEAIVLAAACSTPSPFLNPSRLGFQDQDDFTTKLRETAEAWRFFDAGHASEPIASLRLFFAWLRRLKLTPPRSNTPARWYRATAMLEKDAAIDSSKMTAFVSYIADLTIRCRDLCSDERDKDLACRVRSDLYGLVQLLRRPDKSREQQKQLTDDSYVPAIGEVFRAPASKIYALLAAAFSDTLLFGTHRASGQEQYIEAMGWLGPSCASSQDAVLIPRHPVMKRTEESVAQIIETISGSQPSQVINGDKIIAVAFPPEEEEESSTPWVSRRHDMMTMGLGPAEEPRMNGLSLAPRMCHMAAGGPRRFNVGEQEFARAISPYEVEFTIMHEARGNRHIMPGLFGEQSSLGFACHVTDPSRLAKDHFACVASDMMLVESGTAARVNNATVLMPEEMVFALTTICPSGMELALGFSQGPGGSADSARAALTGLRLTTRRKDNRQLLFNRNLPGFKVMGKVNAVRSAILENLVSPAEANSSGQEILLWEDEAAQEDFEDLLRMINEAPTIEDLGGAYGADRQPVTWVRHRQRLRSAKQEEESTEEDADDEVEDADEDAEDADVRALQPILLFPGLEPQVAKRTAESSPMISHSFECPDCADRFQDWDACREHLVNTGHLDVSTPEAETLARKQLTKPVRWRCLECFEGFATKAELEKHLSETNHLAFAETDAVRFNLCKPRPIPELDDPVAAFSRRLQGFGEEAEPEAAAEEEPVGFFRSLQRTLSAPSSIPARQNQELLPEIVELVRDINLDLPTKLKLQQLELEDARDVIELMKRNRAPISNPNGWLLKAIEKRQRQVQELLPEFRALVQDVKDLDISVKLQLQSLELEQARDLVDQMKRNPVPVKKPSAWLGSAIATRIRRLKEADTPRAATAKPKAKPKATKQKQPEKEAETPKAATAKPKAIAKAKKQKQPEKEAETPKAATAKPKAIAKAKKQKQPEKTRGQEALEIPSPPPPPPLPRLEEAETPKAATAKPKAIAKAKKQKQPEKASGQEAAEIPSPPPLPPLPRLEDVKPTAATAKPKAKPQANEQDAAKVKDFVSKLKQADRDEQILAAVLEVAGGSIDPKTSLNLVMQRLRGTNDATVYKCEQRGTTFEGKVALTGEEGTVEFVAKGATKKQAQVNAARVALQGFEQVLERCRPKVDAVAS